MNTERIIAAIEAFQNAEGADAAVAAMHKLNHVKYELKAELEKMREGGAVSLPEGFVEFAMNVMKEAKELRAKGGEPLAVAFSDITGRAHWFASANVQAMGMIDESPLLELTKIAANALLLAVEPPTMEGTANAPH